MLNIGSIIKPWKETGDLCSRINLYGFWNENTFLTKSGALGCVLKLDGIDYESIEAQKQVQLVQRLERALKTLGPDYHVYEYFFKHNHPEIPFATYDDELLDSAIKQRRAFFEAKADHLYDAEIYYVILYQNPRTQPSLMRDIVGLFANLFNNPLAWCKKIFNHFSSDKVLQLLKKNLVDDATALRRTIDSIQRVLQLNCSTQLLNKDEQFTFFRRLINFEPHAIKGKLHSTRFLDYQVGNSTVSRYDDYMLVGRKKVRQLVMKEAPSSTAPLMFKELLKVDIPFAMCLEWNALAPSKAKWMINSKRIHSNVAKGGISFSSGDRREKDELRDEGLQDDVEQLSAALKDVGKGHVLGELSLTFTLVSDKVSELDEWTAKLTSMFADIDSALIAETVNKESALFSIIPGNTHENLRRKLFFSYNLADLSFLFTIHSGSKINKHLNAEYLALLETENRTPFYLNLHTKDIAHTLILGMTGSGKSFFCNFLINSFQKYKPFTFIFDIGGSYRSITEMHGGSYIDVGLDSKNFKINPFCLEPTEANLNFLFALMRVVLESNENYTSTDKDEQTLWFAIRAVYDQDKEFRRMGIFASLCGDLKPRFARWIRGGQYGWLFDNAEDSVTFSRFQTYNFSGFGDKSDALPVLLFYIFHRMNAVIESPDNIGTLKIFLCDEAGRFFDNPVIADRLEHALETWRKHDGALITATQDVYQLASSNMLNVYATSCLTQIYLANPNMDRKMYAESFKLNDTVLDMIESLTPPGQIVFKQLDFAKKLTLNVDDIAYWMATNSGQDNAKKKKYFSEYGITAGIKKLAADYPVKPIHQ